MGIVGLKNSMFKNKNVLDEYNRRVEMMKERFSEFEY